MPKRSVWRVLQFDTLRLRLIKLAAGVVPSVYAGWKSWSRNGDENR